MHRMLWQHTCTQTLSPTPTNIRSPIHAHIHTNPHELSHAHKAYELDGLAQNTHELEAIARGRGCKLQQNMTKRTAWSGDTHSHTHTRTYTHTLTPTHAHTHTHTTTHAHTIHTHRMEQYRGGAVNYSRI